MADPDLQISRGGGGLGGGHFFLLFGPQFALIIMEGEGEGRLSWTPH